MKLIFTLAAILLAAIAFPQKSHAYDNHSNPSARLIFEAYEPQNSFDARIVALENTFKQYNSQLVGEAKYYTYYADKYNIDWKLLPSIAGLESTFAKHMIPGTYNAYGWGSGQIYFKSWEDGIDKISFSLRKNYYNRGADTVYKIAPIYAESKTWAPRVTFFMNKIEEEHERLVALPTKNLSL